MTADWLNVKHNTYNLQDSHPKGDSIDPNNPFICRSVQKKKATDLFYPKETDTLWKLD